MRRLSCEICGRQILRDEQEIYRGVTRTLCIFCEDDYQDAKWEMADIMAEYKKAKRRD